MIFFYKNKKFPLKKAAIPEYRRYHLTEDYINKFTIICKSEYNQSNSDYNLNHRIRDRSVKSFLYLILKLFVAYIILIKLFLSTENLHLIN